MAITLPDQASANAASAAAAAAALASAQSQYIASVTVLINNATKNGFLRVQPYLIPPITSAFVTSYFEALGYTITFPAFADGCNCSGNAGYPYIPCFVAGFPEVLPPGYIPWDCECGFPGPPRIQITWGPPVENFLLLEDGSVLELEIGPGALLLE